MLLLNNFIQEEIDSRLKFSRKNFHTPLLK